MGQLFGRGHLDQVRSRTHTARRQALRVVSSAPVPDLAALKSAARAAIVMPAVFAFADKVIEQPQTSMFAAFGSFALLVLVDFAGPPRSASRAYAGLWRAPARRSSRSGRSARATRCSPRARWRSSASSSSSRACSAATSPRPRPPRSHVRPAGDDSGAELRDSRPARRLGRSRSRRRHLRADAPLAAPPVADPHRQAARRVARRRRPRWTRTGATGWRRTRSPGREAVDGSGGGFSARSTARPARPDRQPRSPRSPTSWTGSCPSSRPSTRPPRSSSSCAEDAEAMDAAAAVLRAGAARLEGRDERPDFARLDATRDAVAQALLRRLPDAVRRRRGRGALAGARAALPDPDGHVRRAPGRAGMPCSRPARTLRSSVTTTSHSRRRRARPSRRPSSSRSSTPASSSVWFQNSVRGAAGLAVAVYIAQRSGPPALVLGRARDAVGPAVERARHRLVDCQRARGDRGRDRRRRAARDRRSARTRRCSGACCRSRCCSPPTRRGRSRSPRDRQGSPSSSSCSSTSSSRSAGSVGLIRVEDVAIGFAISLGVGLLFWPRGAARAATRGPCRRVCAQRGLRRRRRPAQLDRRSRLRRARLAQRGPQTPPSTGSTTPFASISRSARRTAVNVESVAALVGGASRVRRAAQSLAALGRHGRRQRRGSSVAARTSTARSMRSSPGTSRSATHSSTIAPCRRRTSATPRAGIGCSRAFGRGPRRRHDNGARSARPALGEPASRQPLAARGASWRARTCGRRAPAGAAGGLSCSHRSRRGLSFELAPRTRQHGGNDVKRLERCCWRPRLSRSYRRDRSRSQTTADRARRTRRAHRPRRRCSR